MDSSDDVEMALLALSESDHESDATEDALPQDQPQPPRTLRIPFYEAAPGELHQQATVPAFVYANRVFHWTERNLLVFSAMIAATLHWVEEELDMQDDERCEEYWRNHRFEPFDPATPPHEIEQRARELQLKLDLIELLLLGLRPDWIPPSWFPSSLPPPQLPPRSDELRGIAGLRPRSTSQQPSNGSGSRTRHVEGHEGIQRLGRRGMDEGSTLGRGLRPRSSLRAPRNADGTARLRPSHRS